MPDTKITADQLPGVIANLHEESEAFLDRALEAILYLVSNQYLPMGATDTLTMATVAQSEPQYSVFLATRLGQEFQRVARSSVVSDFLQYTQLIGSESLITGNPFISIVPEVDGDISHTRVEALVAPQSLIGLPSGTVEQLDHPASDEEGLWSLVYKLFGLAVQLAKYQKQVKNVGVVSLQFGEAVFKTRPEFQETLLNLSEALQFVINQFLYFINMLEGRAATIEEQVIEGDWKTKNLPKAKEILVELKKVVISIKDYCLLLEQIASAGIDADATTLLSRVHATVVLGHDRQAPTASPAATSTHAMLAASGSSMESSDDLVTVQSSFSEEMPSYPEKLGDSEIAKDITKFFSHLLSSLPDPSLYYSLLGWLIVYTSRLQALEESDDKSSGKSETGEAIKIDQTKEDKENLKALFDLLTSRPDVASALQGAVPQALDWFERHAGESLPAPSLGGYKKT